MTGCPHGMPTPGSCVECMAEGNLPPPPKPPPLTVTGRFAARYPGQCRACPDPIAVGDPISHLSNGAYVHRECEP